MDKINLMQGDVLKFADFVCEKLEVSIKPKEITSDKDGQYVMIKGTIHQKYITAINIQA